MTIVLLAAATVAQPAVLAPPSGPTLAVSPEIARLQPNGTELIQVVVSPDGSASNCVASIVGRGTITDKENCGKALKYRATPAVDQNGQKVFGTVGVMLSWNVIRSGRASAPAPSIAAAPDLYLPLGHRPEGVDANATSRLVIVASNDGKVETCEVQRTSGLVALDTAACRAVTALGVSALKDGTGVPVRGVQTMSIGFSVKP